MGERIEEMNVKTSLMSNRYRTSRSECGTMNRVWSCDTFLGTGSTKFSNAGESRVGEAVVCMGNQPMRKLRVAWYQAM